MTNIERTWKSLTRTLREAFTENLALKALSLVVALGLAAYSRGQLDRTQRTVPVGVVLRLPPESKHRELMTQVPANVDVTAPRWLSGGIPVMVGVQLPYNRLFIIGLAAICVAAMYLLLFRTDAGLRIRAVTQNRGMAACLGVRARWVDAGTFALGAGLAGLAGCAITQIGNVGPELGQNYIVDSFMVVVTGGVGKLLGSILAAIGIGGLNKIIEPGMGAVFGKVLILVLVILFIQRRPSGLFATKGRYAES